MKAHETRKTSWFDSDMEDYARSKGLQLRADAPVSLPVPRGGKRSSPNPPRRSIVDKKKIKCWYCGKLGHFSKECYGKDEGYKFAPKKRKWIDKLDINTDDQITDDDSSRASSDLS